MTWAKNYRKLNDHLVGLNRGIQRLTGFKENYHLSLPRQYDSSNTDCGPIFEKLYGSVCIFYRQLFTPLSEEFSQLWATFGRWLFGPLAWSEQAVAFTQQAHEAAHLPRFFPVRL